MIRHSANLPTAAFARSIAERFGQHPTTIARAPGRVNLIGDHVDYCGGLVLPMAIPQSCCCGIIPDPALGPTAAITTNSFQDSIRFDPTDHLVPGDHAAVGSWGSYALGVIAGLSELHDTSGLAGTRLHLASDIPLGAGLSSSAALEVSVAKAVGHHLGLALDGVELAKLCQTAENRFAGMPCGLMDQAASVLGEAGCAVRLDCATEAARPVPIPGEARILVLHSGVSHALADGAYAKRRRSCDEAARSLGVPFLAHARREDLAQLPGHLRPFARHVVTETARVEAACAALERGDLAAFGACMSESHASLRDDFAVSCEEVDALVLVLEQATGCLGARMTGGGFGGCVVTLCMPDAEESIIVAAESARHACPNLSLVEVYPSAGASLEIIP